MICIGGNVFATVSRWNVLDLPPPFQFMVGSVPSACNEYAFAQGLLKFSRIDII